MRHESDIENALFMAMEYVLSNRMRREEFRQLTLVQKKLERRSKIIMFDDEQLQELIAMRCSPFDIDEDDPIDLDSRKCVLYHS
ncbi:hypothetical protein CDV36_004921 [Fusarium kuroshium]|uniref:Uncharacterized protein n=1 Tax=Fusarium kuroshium TaxID=2010991 RepID=A0A3M2SDU7_9HYPO|nr:hypothetical protein CDV36_004921 [Fusarium kuroshium]